MADALGTEGRTEVEIRRIPTEADFLMAYSVVPGGEHTCNFFYQLWTIAVLDTFLDEI